METTTTTFAGYETRVIRTEGDRDLPAFLLLHGFSDSADGWRRLQRRLEEAGCASTAVDQPSHGAAAPLDSALPVIPQFVEFARAAAADADRGRGVIVVGNSLGGAHALLLAERHPEAVLGVVAVSPASFDHPRWFGILDEESRMARVMRSRLPDDDEVKLGFVGRTVAEGAIRTVAFGRPWRAPSGFVRDMRRQFRDPVRRTALRDLASRVPAEYLDVDCVDLAAIDRPVLVLWGSLDRLTLVSSKRTFERSVRDLDFVQLRGVGHMPQLEVPGRTTKHLLAFAERLTLGQVAEAS